MTSKRFRIHAAILAAGLALALPSRAADDGPRPFSATFAGGTATKTFTEDDVGGDLIAQVAGSMVFLNAALATTVTVSLITGGVTGIVDTIEIASAASAVWDPPLYFYVVPGDALKFASGNTNAAGKVKGWTE